MALVVSIAVHVIPRVSDGSNDDGNLVAACRDCNLGKGVTLLTS